MNWAAGVGDARLGDWGVDAEDVADCRDADECEMDDVLPRRVWVLGWVG